MPVTATLTARQAALINAELANPTVPSTEPDPAAPNDPAMSVTFDNATQVQVINAIRNLQIPPRTRLAMIGAVLDSTAG